MSGLGVLAVDISTAPKHIQEEIESLQGKVNSMDDMEHVSKETKRWIMENADPTAMWKQMEQQMKKAIADMSIYTRGIVMLKTVMPEDKAKKVNLDLYNVCAEYVREYNKVNF